MAFGRKELEEDQDRDPFQEALDALETGVPSYMVAADTLNTANNNKTFLESAVDTVDSVQKFIGLSALSAVNQVTNIPADIGNLFGGDFERTETVDVVNSLDSDLGRFYQENQEGIDLVGFIASSLIPGTAGVKALNAGQIALRGAQAGKVGKGMGIAMKVLAPNSKAKMAKAVDEVINYNSVASLTNASSLKAIASGVHQNVLEAAAFEIATAATLFNSPVLEGQEFKDYITNIAISGGVFGILGGVVTGAKLNSALGKARDTADLADRPWTMIPAHASSSTPYERIAIDLDTIANMPIISDDLTESVIAHRKTIARRTVATLHNRIRTDLREIANGDDVIANTMFDIFKTADRDTALSAFVSLGEMSRVTEVGKLGKRLAELERKATSPKADGLTAEEATEYLNTSVHVGTVKMWGEDAGKVIDGVKERLTQVSDTLKKGEEIRVDPKKGVRIVKKGATSKKAGELKYKHSLIPNLPKKVKLGKKAEPIDIKKMWTSTKAGSNPLDANARFIWAQSLDKFDTSKGLTIHVEDIPLMEKVLTDGLSKTEIEQIRFVGLKEGELDLATVDFPAFLQAQKIKVATNLLAKKGEGITRGGKPLKSFLDNEQIAAIVNIRKSVFEGQVIPSPNATLHPDDLMALQSYAREYTEKLIAQGDLKPDAGLVRIWEQPQHIRLTYDTELAARKAVERNKNINFTALKGNSIGELNNHVLDNLAIIKEQQKLYGMDLDNAASYVLAEDFGKFLDISGGAAGDIATKATSSGAGAGAFSAAISRYGSLGATVEFIGKQTASVITKFQSRTTEALNPLLSKLAKNREAAIEWAVLNRTLRGIEGDYALNAAGDALEPAAIVRWKQMAEQAAAVGKEAPPMPEISPAMLARIDIKDDTVRKLVGAHIELNGKRNMGLASIRAAQGQQFNRAPDVFYPLPVDTRDYQYFASVYDERLTAVGNPNTMLYATSEQELKDMITRITNNNPGVTIRTKAETEAYFKGKGQFEYEKTLHDNYADSSMKRMGDSAPYIVPTDPNKIVKDMLKWHMEREAGLVREAVSAKYEVAFDELRSLGENFTNVATSKFGNLSLDEFADSVVANPYVDFIKTALNVRRTSDYPILTNFNKNVDDIFSKMYKNIAKVQQKAKSPEDLLEIQAIMERVGYKGAQYDESMEIFSNINPARGALSSLVQKANSVLATVVLRWDTLNAINNAVSANVLLGTEVKAVIRAIERGDSEAVGQLAELTRIAVPGTDQTVFSAGKLISNAIRKFHEVGRNSDEFRFFEDHGFMTRISDQYRNVLDDLSFRGTAGDFSAGINKAFKTAKEMGDKGEVLTGNRLAEEFNRFVAADVMKQLTDIAVSKNLMTTKEQLSYINTFVNRTQGNYQASQRPIVFQGAVGQAVSLFQTYQFNLMQQLLRHVGEGSAKDAATLLALQGTIHGMNGLPAFNAVNTHIIGTASGNTENKDIYTTLYGVAGKTAGDWLMYGAASNALGLLHPDLRINLYTRGDLNPRNVTILPVNPAEIPIVQAYGRFFSNLMNTSKQLALGGDVTTTILQGFEKNGLSRPLAGLAQALEGFNNPLKASYSTSNRGNVIAANDLLSVANLSRLVGGKPLDEAIALDAAFRFKAYALQQNKRKQQLGKAIKSTMLAGNMPTQEQLDSFIDKFVQRGGKQAEFNQWIGQLYSAANTSQANEISRALDTPYAKAMQELMGDRELRDFTND